MKTISKFIALILFAPAFSLADYHPPVEYGVAVTIDFVLYNTDGTLDIDEVDGGTEVTAHCDGDAGTTATNDFVDEGSYYSIALTAGEASCARITLDIAATDRNVIIIPTFGNASAQVDDDRLTAIASGTAQAGTSTTIQLASAETFGNDILIGACAVLTGGTGAGQHAVIIGYVGATDTATVFTQYTSNQWVTNPDSTSVYEIVNCTINVQVWNSTGVTSNVETSADIADAIRSEPCGSETPDTLGDLICNDLEGLADGSIIVTANMTQISGDTTAADNLESFSDGTTAQPVNATEISGDATAADNAEAFFDGTGYAGTNNVIPLVTAITDTVNADMVSVSGDTTSANNLELQYDTTGLTGNTFPATQLALATAQSDLDIITGSNGATISTASIQAFWDIQCEDQGSGLTCQEAMSILLAEAAGTAVYTSGSRTWIVKDPSGTETRLTLVYGAELDGDRDTSTLAPFTP